MLMMTSVLGALAGGAIFQWLFGFPFSVAVWVGYIACFGMATETGIVMLVYLREAIAERGGLENIRSVAELREAILEGAIHRLRPKLLTEGTTIIAIAPMLWADGVGAEVIRPMAAPVLGGPPHRRRGDRRLPARPLLRRPEVALAPPPRPGPVRRRGEVERRPRAGRGRLGGVIWNCMAGSGALYSSLGPMLSSSSQPNGLRKMPGRNDTMNISFEIPGEIERELGTDGADLSGEAKEAFSSSSIGEIKFRCISSLERWACPATKPKGS